MEAVSPKPVRLLVAVECLLGALHQDKMEKKYTKERLLYGGAQHIMLELVGHNRDLLLLLFFCTISKGSRESCLTYLIYFYCSSTLKLSKIFFKSFKICFYYLNLLSSLGEFISLLYIEKFRRWRKTMADAMQWVLSFLY